MEASVQDQAPQEEPPAWPVEAPELDAPEDEQEQDQPGEAEAETMPSGTIIGTIPATQEDLDNLKGGVA